MNSALLDAYNAKKPYKLAQLTTIKSKLNLNMTTQSDANNNVKEDKQQDMEKLLEDKELIKFPLVGEILKGKVISIGKNEVRLDIDGISTGIIRGRELNDESGEFSNLSIDDDAEATVLEIENENGEVEMSFRYAGHKKAWDRLQDLMDKQEMVDIDVLDANKGGLMIRVGKILGFMPVSQLSPEHYPRVPGGDKNKILEKLRQHVGTIMKARVIAADEPDEKLIVSEKAAMAEEQKVRMSQFKINDAVDCKITAITDFGVFVTFADHMEGLIHISELAWQRIDDPRKLYKVGQEVQAEIISMEDSKVFLSIKKLEKDPWHNVEEKYKAGQIVKGKVLKANPFGFFVELDKHIHGLAHISELSSKPVANPREIAKPGDVLDFKIISIEASDHRLGLSLKAAQEKNQTDQAKKPEEPAQVDEASRDNEKNENPSTDSDEPELSTDNDASELDSGTKEELNEDDNKDKDKSEDKSKGEEEAKPQETSA